MVRLKFHVIRKHYVIFLLQSSFLVVHGPIDSVLEIKLVHKYTMLLWSCELEKRAFIGTKGKAGTFYSFV